MPAKSCLRRSPRLLCRCRTRPGTTSGRPRRRPSAARQSIREVVRSRPAVTPPRNVLLRTALVLQRHEKVPLVRRQPEHHLCDAVPRGHRKLWRPEPDARLTTRKNRPVAEIGTRWLQKADVGGSRAGNCHRTPPSPRDLRPGHLSARLLHVGHRIQQAKSLGRGDRNVVGGVVETADDFVEVIGGDGLSGAKSKCAPDQIGRSTDDAELFCGQVFRTAEESCRQVSHPPCAQPRSLPAPVG